MTDPQPPPPLPANGKMPAPVAILTVVLLYAVMASLWILFSDKAVGMIFHADPGRIVLASTIKGWLFVGVTSMLLYGLIRRLPCRSETAAISAASLRPLALPLTLLIMAIVALTAGGITHTFIHQKDLDVARLQAIADLKARQIADWLGERQGDVRFVQSSQNWTELYLRWRDTGDEESLVKLQGRLERFREVNAFQGILLLDEGGEPLWVSPGTTPTIDPYLAEAIRQAATERVMAHLEPYREASGKLRLDFIAPLPTVGGRQGPVVVLRADPAAYLFPALQTWPAPSPSGETLLFRRDGDQVLFLNELRHRPDTAVRLRRSVTEKRLLASQVVRGEVELGHLVEGVDYRGVPVMGVVRAIPGTDWFLVAKLDRAEVYAEAVDDLLWITLVGLLALFVTAAGAFLFRQRQELAFSIREGRAQAERLRALQLLDAIAASSTDAIFAKDRHGRYLFFNQAAGRFVGKEPGEVLGQDDTALFPPEQATLLMANERQVMAENHTVTIQEELRTPVGEFTFLTTKGALHDGEGKVIGIFGISHDITERKRAEEERERLQGQLLQAQKMESVGRLAGGVAHDFNNMLSVIIGYAELALTRDDLPEEVSQGLLEIKKAGERSADLTRQLLAFARKQAVNPRVLDLNDTMAGMLKMLRRLIGENIELAWMPGADRWQVRIDPAQIDQILANLAVNARDAIAGQGKVTIRTGSVTIDQARGDLSAGDFVTLSVSDDGRGMEEEVITRIFEPFFTTKGVGQGTGLGLATVYGIVRQNQGDIEVRSEPGQGTTFTIYLPRFLGQEGEATAASLEETPRGREETLLLVEDEGTIREVTTAMLERLGYTVLAAKAPEEAIGLVESGVEIQLLITDVVMPGMNGWELAERIRALKPGLKCLFMSGYAIDTIGPQGGPLDQGVRFIQKPFSLHELATLVRATMEQG